ncbi:MAG: DUF4430 domain-containing protein [Oscillospiraceae bacterium]|nr:DUF4430 domain-containing protein [Oscillospiraceae bacterium]
MSKKTRNIVIAVAVLLVLVIGALLIYNSAKPDAVAGDKNLLIVVVHGDESRKEFPINTSAETLRGALEQESLIEGTESEYGIYITSVDGEAADESLQQWWCITKNGEMLMTGADDTMIADGEQYELTLTTGW